MKNKNKRIHALRLSPVVAVLALHAGCMTLEQMAPPVDVEFQRVAARYQVDVPALELGRRVYVSDCARCHGVEPISRYSKSRWREILPRMGRETKLDAEEQVALSAYVMSAHTYLEYESTRLAAERNALRQAIRHEPQTVRAGSREK